MYHYMVNNHFKVLYKDKEHNALYPHDGTG